MSLTIDSATAVPGPTMQQLDAATNDLADALAEASDGFADVPQYVLSAAVRLLAFGTDGGRTFEHLRAVLATPGRAS
ncbi:hypothetical protein [Cellulosimicrobium sp. Marseille-Q4280]|uniref:hypothetical protein n=1 Tax=Cellulosimicrobium sp. Marseille-Q4280 TaxID=2937992 RepID=UPI0020413A52|nr:hypothetical protein [Cellulosimicrobium sp. Marseille-Q4280]